MIINHISRRMFSLKFVHERLNIGKEKGILLGEQRILNTKKPSSS